MNHQHRLEADQRSEAVYGRPEFVAALTVPVLPTRDLFEWWRTSDWEAIRIAVLRQSADEAEGGTARRTGPSPLPQPLAPAPAPEPRRVLGRLGRGPRRDAPKGRGSRW